MGRLRKHARLRKLLADWQATRLLVSISAFICNTTMLPTIEGRRSRHTSTVSHEYGGAPRRWIFSQRSTATVNLTKVERVLLI